MEIPRSSATRSSMFIPFLDLLLKAYHGYQKKTAVAIHAVFKIQPKLVKLLPFLHHLINSFNFAAVMGPTLPKPVDTGSPEFTMP